MAKTFHCLFEQSGTFKKEFKSLGYDAIDYDIENQFGQTDVIIDLFDQIEKAYVGDASLFDDIKDDDEIMAFFPCTRFEVQVLLSFRGDNCGFKNWDLIKKLEYDITLHKELHQFYTLITKLVIVCIRKNIPLIIENPYSSQHYLTKYWCIKPSVIDKNRRDNGDYYNKPTQYWFINRKPSNNLSFEPQVINPKLIVSETSGITRSLISPDYARRFIKEFVI